MRRLCFVRTRVGLIRQEREKKKGNHARSIFAWTSRGSDEKERRVEKKKKRERKSRDPSDRMVACDAGKKRKKSRNLLTVVTCIT